MSGLRYKPPLRVPSRVDVSSLIDALAGASAMARKSHQIEWPVLERVVLALSSRLK
jgi:hypothetical protein